MTVSPPFQIVETLPGNQDIVAQYPAVERLFRDTVESWLLFEHGRSGHHKFMVLTTAARDAISDWELGSLIYNTTLSALQVVTSIGPVVWTTEAGLDAEFIQDTIGALLADSANIDFTYNDAGNSLSADLVSTAVTPGSYTSANLTVDAKGRLTAAASGGGLVTIQSGSLPAAAVLDITNIPQDFSYLILQLTGASHNDAASRVLLVQVDTDNGASFDTTAANYPGEFHAMAGATADKTLATLGAENIQGAATTTDATHFLWGYASGPLKRFETYSKLSTTNARLVHGYYIGSTAGINALRVLWDGAGNFDAGTYALYGVR